MSVVEVVGGRILGEDGLGRGSLIFRGETILGVEPASSADDAIDADGLIVAPGFVDVQINGGHGIELEREPERVWDLARLLPRHGVTSFLPTIISSGVDVREGMLRALRRPPGTRVGAEPLGAHFEGPMLEPGRRGIHPLDQLVGPGPDVIEGWTRDGGVAMVTIAPELPGAIDVIAELVRRGVTVALGHSNATSAQAREATDAGATVVTHLFNAMAPLGHRAPGLVGVALAEPELAAGLIVDGVHVDPTVVAATWNAKGPTGIVLITDAVSAMGEAPGHHDVGGVPVVVDAGAPRDATGRLAGSVLTMDRAVRNLVSYTGCRPEEALISASATPAGVIREMRRGTLASGAIADLVLLDERLDVKITVCAGVVTFVADGAGDRLPPRLMEGQATWK